MMMSGDNLNKKIQVAIDSNTGSWEKKLISTSNCYSFCALPPKKGQSGQSGCLVFFFASFVAPFLGHTNSPRNLQQDPLNERTPKKPGQLSESVQRSEGEAEKKNHPRFWPRESNDTCWMEIDWS